MGNNEQCAHFMLILNMFKYTKFKLCTLPKSWLINKQNYNATKKKYKSREHLKGDKSLDSMLLEKVTNLVRLCRESSSI